MITNDPYFQITEITVPLKGLTQPVDLLQITDLHISHAEPDSTDERKERVLRQKKAWEGVRRDFAVRYGDSLDPAHLLDPEEGWHHIVKLANTAPVDGVLFCGDMMEDYSPENLDYLAKGLDEIRIPWMWVCGNHETRHEDEYVPYMRGDPSVQIWDVKELRIIGINNAQKQVTAEQTERIDNAASGYASVLAMHIPMLTAYNPEDAGVFGEYFLMGTGDVLPDTAAFLERIVKPESPVQAVLCGHVHGRHVSEYAPGKPQICASSCMVGACNLIRFVPVQKENGACDESENRHE